MTRSANNTIKKHQKQIKELTQGLAYVPPHSDELEGAILGAMIIQQSAVFQVLEIIFNPEVFYRDCNKKIFIAIVDLYKSDSNIDLVTIIHNLRSKNELDLIGGMSYVANLTNMVNTAAHIQFHARILLEYWMRRKMIESAEIQRSMAYDESIDVFDAMMYATKAHEEVTSVLSIGEEKTIGQYIPKVIENILRARELDGLSGVPSGIIELDKMTGGWQDTDLIIIAGRPGMGKTTAVLQFAKNASNMFDYNVGFFSLEMGAEQLVKKIVASEVGVSTSQLNKGKISDTTIQEIQLKKSLNNSKLLIDDTAGLNIMQFKAKASKLVRKYNVKLIIIDYLQLMQGDRTQGGNREQEISNISRSLKIVAKTLGIPVIALSQLSRSVEQRGGDKRPQLSDLRESGAIEQDADLVIFCYRPEYYKIEQDEMGVSMIDKMAFILAKHRNGGLDDVWVHADMKKSLICDLDSIPQKQPEYTFDDKSGEVFQLPEKNDVFKSINGASHFERNENMQ